MLRVACGLGLWVSGVGIYRLLKKPETKPRLDFGFGPRKFRLCGVAAAICESNSLQRASSFVTSLLSCVVVLASLLPLSLSFYVASALRFGSFSTEVKACVY